MPNTYRSANLATYALLVLLGGTTQSATAQTALDTYVDTIDGSYGYSLANTVTGAGFTGYNIDLTSQTWRDPSEITHNLWQHKMTIVQPDTVLTNTAILVIGGGSNPGDFDPGDLTELAAAALLTKSVVLSLPMVPNQPLTFAGESSGRSEDAIIAKTFAKFLENNPADSNVDQWPLLLPMVKSAVAAMDATQDHMGNLPVPVQIDKFFILGGSKRGWTTWLTAAVEARPGGPNRVKAIAPGVIDMLNTDESMQHHRSVYEAGPVPPVNCTAIGVPAGCSLFDGFSLAVGDYVLEGVMNQLAPMPGETISPRAQELLDIVDPYEYRDRLVLPKYVVNSTGDQFFAPDSSQFYFQDLSGEKYLRYIPNTDHSLDDTAIPGALVFHTALELGLPLPDITWDISADGTSILADTDIAPQEVKMWQATNPANRDFRLATFGAGWTESVLPEQAPGQYLASVVAPATGATAFMIEFTYLVGGQELKFTTDISVVQIPEPTATALMLSGLSLGLFGPRRASRRSTRPN